MTSIAVNTTLDMARLDLRRFAHVVFNSSFNGPGYTVIVLTNAAGEQIRLRGTGFGAYDSDGVPHIGSVTGFDVIQTGNANVWINLDFAPIAVSDLLTAVGTLDVASLQAYFFSGNDQLNGFNGIDVLLGGDGNDIIGGNGGNDTIRGGAGNDDMHGDAGVNTINGEAGDDWMTAGAGTDRFDGGDGIDKVDFWRATSGVTLDLSKILAQTPGGGIGALTVLHVENILGSDYADHLTGGSTANDIKGLLGDDNILGMGGDDTLWGGDGDDTLDGGTGSDTLNGEGGADHLIGGVGLNKLNGGDGDDTIDGGLNNDVIDGGKGNDHATGGGGTDVMWGGDGDDTFDGGDGIDVITGDAGNDTLIGGKANDILDGGVGADTMSGGLNSDTYYVDNADDLVIELAETGVDSVTTSINAYALTANVENLFLAQIESIVTGRGNAGNNEIIGNNFTNDLYGLAGNDHISGQGGDDSLHGGEGNDLLAGDAGMDTLYGGIGNDQYQINDALDVVVEEIGEGTDTILAGISLTLANNVENLIIVGAGDLAGTGNGLNNTLTGNEANNSLTGGTGNDRMTGGAGADSFVITQASIHSTVAKLALEVDIITDLNFSQGDRIDLSGVDANINLAGHQGFTFVAAFDKHAGQATLAYVAASNTTQFKLDVDGDGKADYQLNIAGNMTDTHFVTGSEGGWLI